MLLWLHVKWLGQWKVLLAFMQRASPVNPLKGPRRGQPESFETWEGLRPAYSAQPSVHVQRSGCLMNDWEPHANLSTLVIASSCRVFLSSGFSTRSM